MAKKPLVLIADTALNSQAILGDILSADAELVTIMREQQFDYWLSDNARLPSLLILDNHFPQASLVEFCTQWQQHPRMRDVPIIVVGLDDEAAELMALTSGASDYLKKPFNPVLTRARIQLHLAQLEQRRRLESMSMTDGLTNIANRRYFNEFYSAEWRRACREKGALGLIMIDIDYFKPFNDHYGHVKGDQCLKAVAQQLKRVIQRPRDCVARYGGEEFVVLLPSIHAEGVTVVAQRLQQAIGALAIEHGYSSAARHISISMGLAWCEPTGHQVDESLLLSADEALYNIKRSGRNHYSDVVVIEPQLIC